MWRKTSFFFANAKTRTSFVCNGVRIELSSRPLHDIELFSHLPPSKHQGYIYVHSLIFALKKNVQWSSNELSICGLDAKLFVRQAEVVNGQLDH